MGTYILHLVESSVCLTLFYLFYFLFLQKDTGFRFIRFYLIASIVLSVLLPFNNLAVNPFRESNFSQVLKIDSKPAQQITAKEIPEISQSIDQTKVITKPNPVDYFKLIFTGYLIVAFCILGRLLLSLGTLVYYSSFSVKERFKNSIILKNEKIKQSFSFLHFIFLNPEGLTKNEVDSIITHENIHASQYHTIDLLLTELLSAVMWFNPIVWLLRKSLRQVHEYLADEGVLNIVFDRLEYQALLINQVAEGRLLSLTSSFNQSLIKKRILMMTKLHSNNRTKLKILTLVPITAILLFSLACVNGQTKNKSNDTAAITTPPPEGAVAPTRMNVLYIGVENPIDVAISGITSDQLEVTIDNGSISGSNGQYIVKPENNGKATITVKSNGKVVKQSMFRVKVTPDPVAAISPTGQMSRSKMDGSISTKELLSAGGIITELQNFDFDMKFKVVSFVLSATVPNSFTVREEISTSDRFSDKQINLIKSLIKNQKLTVEEIFVTGPDGLKRKLSAMVFTISGE